jgi:hypothetical protein
MLIHGMYIKHRNFVTTLKLDKNVAAAEGAAYLERWTEWR